MKHSRYGVANWFVRLALDDETIKVFGNGEIKRDFLYVDDCVRALIMSAIDERAYGQVMNVGVDTPSNFLELAQVVTRLAKTGRWEFAPFSPERAAQEPGDFYSDIRKIRTLIGWMPQVSLEDGIRATLDYYRTYKSNYW
jgi:UDP-glucose 4-epimerase